ncbi:MAG: OsmC family protein [Candidatus Hodarchaeota archaeon]
MKIEVKWDGNVRFKAKTRQFSNIIIDEPAEFHGDDKGPSSIEYLGVAIGGCLGTSFSFCLQKMEVPIKDMDLVLDVKMTHVEEGDKNPLRIVNIDADINVTLENEEDEDILELCIEAFKKYCVVTQSVMGGIPVNINVKKV